ncbi:unnamed protein product [Tetraodon nigroviridis]|uniref:YTH domain-containing family protein n=1 Tax=Tetraodon nigroviridis TaxID=99883 RepID=Q4RME7_TETNG|nr:unnamed protein product [Tetraodon nigroviridis]
MNHLDPIQRPKGQGNKDLLFLVQNGAVTQKDTLNDDEFEPYLSTQARQSNAYTAMSDSYMPSYYSPSIGFSYSLNEAAWSTGGPLGSNPFLNQHGFNFFPGGIDFSAWGNSNSQGQSGTPQSSGYSSSYAYAPSSLGGAMIDGQSPFAPGANEPLNKAPGMNSLDQGMAGLKLGGVAPGGNGDMAPKVVGSGLPGGGPLGPVSSVGTPSMPPVSIATAKPASWADIASKPAKPQPKLKTKGGDGWRQFATSAHQTQHGHWHVGQQGNGQPPNQVSPQPGATAAGNPQMPLSNGPLVPTVSQMGPHQLPPGQPGLVQIPQVSLSQGPPPPSHHQQQQAPQPTRWVAPRNRANGFGDPSGNGPGQSPPTSSGVAVVPGVPSEPHPVLEKLRMVNNYNPKDFDWNPKQGRVFIIKSYSEDDIHRSIKYNIWCSTEHGNKRLDAAYRSLGAKGPLYLLFSVNGSGHFCGVAEMRSPVDYNTSRWRVVAGQDVPNSQLRHIRLENNENKPVTNSRDTQEVPLDKARQVLKIIAGYKHTTSIFDDFSHYEKRQEEEECVKKFMLVCACSQTSGALSYARVYVQPSWLTHTDGSALGAALLSFAFCVTGGGPGQRAISQQPKQQESLQASGAPRTSQVTVGALVKNCSGPAPKALSTPSRHHTRISKHANRAVLILDLLGTRHGSGRTLGCMASERLAVVSGDGGIYTRHQGLPVRVGVCTGKHAFTVSSVDPAYLLCKYWRQRILLNSFSRVKGGLSVCVCVCVCVQG